MAGPTCALSGCNKPPWPPSPGCATPHLTCGNLHHQLLMASRFNPARPSPYIAILNRNAAGLCALLSCKKPRYPGHSWCSRTHYLDWLAEFTASLHPEQICELPDCTRHVFVDEKGPPSKFCGWKHQQKSVKLSALKRQRHQQEALPAMEAHPRSPPPSIESECGLVPSLYSCMHALKQFALDRIPPKGIRVMEDFYDKHPWDIFTEGHACVLIARLQFTRKGRKLTTKDHYHWKQSGPRTKKSKLYTAKYYTYMKRKGKEKEGDEQHVESSYTMKEYTMEGVKSHSLIKRVKEKPSSPAKPRKEQATHQQHVVEFNNACSQDLWNDDMDLDLWNDDMSVDSIYGELSPLRSCPLNALLLEV